jgi:methylated-DNA-protein-cysteine methyltransferase related protein
VREIASDKNYRERVFEIVRRIPSGRVMTYGQIAEILGDDYTPRTVGYVMNAADEGVPWQRVINSQGGCSTGHVVLPPDLQQRILTNEGVKFNDKGRCDLKVYRWQPDEVSSSKFQVSSSDEQPSLFDE